MCCCIPTGDFSDEERARKRSITLGQEYDGMSRLSVMITQELRTAIQAMLAALGTCNFDDETPVVGAEPDGDAVRRDQSCRQSDTTRPR